MVMVALSFEDFVCGSGCGLFWWRWLWLAVVVDFFFFFHCFFPANQTTIYDSLVKFKATSRVIEIPKVELEKVAGRALYGRGKVVVEKKRENKGAGETNRLEKHRRRTKQREKKNG